MRLPAVQGGCFTSRTLGNLVGEMPGLGHELRGQAGGAGRGP